jgi:hypothetical protein
MEACGFRKFGNVGWLNGMYAVSCQFFSWSCGIGFSCDSRAAFRLRRLKQRKSTIASTSTARIEITTDSMILRSVLELDTLDVVLEESTVDDELGIDAAA